jgi:hypothetical protein
MANVALPPQKQDLLAGVLSYLVPGLGQIYQGRIAKGILFFVCVYGLLFYGMKLGSWSNVYLPRATPRSINLWDDLFARPQFVGQFWSGIVVWPAVYHYVNFDDNSTVADNYRTKGQTFSNWQRTPFEAREGTEQYSNRSSAPTPAAAPLGWPGKTLNELQTEGDKTWDLAWVYTVVAGVLNILVIYDAFAGPAYTAEVLAKSKEESSKHVDGAPVPAS